MSFFMQETIIYLYNYFLKPRSENEDSKRREFILNVVLLGSIILSVTGTIVVIFDSIRLAPNYSGISPIFFSVIFLIFLTLYSLSRKDFFIVSSYTLIVILFFSTTYGAYKWGVNLPACLLSYALVIIISGILLGTRFAFKITAIISSILITLNYLHSHKIIIPDLSWKINKTIDMEEVVLLVVILFIIMTVSWLSNREIEKSLKRARGSEAELQKERDSLEIKVDERTKQLKKVQMEKMEHLYRSAEFGNLSAGLFHDLVNPLTAISLNLEQVQDREDEGLYGAKTYLTEALSATRRMENFITAVKKQIAHQEETTLFSLTEEIKQIIQLFSYKARKADIEIMFAPTADIQTYGDAIKFSQIITNLISNAIDAYENVELLNRPKNILINLAIENNIICLIVQDWGKGIANENISKIFEPFFSTKSAVQDLGIGLSIIKNIIENNFQGSIKAESKQWETTRFIVKFPRKLYG